MKYLSDALLKDLGFDLIEDMAEIDTMPSNVLKLPLKTFNFGDRALQVHVSNLIAEFGIDAVIDELIRRIK